MNEDYSVMITRQINELNGDRTNLIEYLTKKTVRENWHGVADAAIDLREIDAKLEVLKKL